MKISVRWLNEYLEPANLTADGVEEILTFVGFPIETAEELANGDVRLDVEVTSNRGDCLSHIGLAREVAAATGRRLRIPAPGRAGEQASSAAPSAGGPDAAATVAIDNRVSDLCRMFTAQVIRGVRVGPSPRWLVEALEAAGQRSINNVVDVTNYVALEYGQPSHVFDLATLHGDGTAEGVRRVRVVVRTAAKGEKLTLLDGRTITLAGDEVVVADLRGGGRAVSLAGLMGGRETEVTTSTTDVLLEAATWEPVAVRRASRRHGVRTEASHRFERIVDPRTIERAAQHAAALIVKLAGGVLAPGIVRAGVEPRPLTVVRLRPLRCAAVLGAEVAAPEIARVLGALEISAAPAEDGALSCTIPAHRPDLEREIDLIEEVARIRGLDKLPVHEKVAVRVGAPQKSERAVRDLCAALTGLGFYETVTFTFVTPEHAAPFMPEGLRPLGVSRERRPADPVLRPSALPSLLACRRKNQDGGAHADDAGDGEGGGVRLFEISSAFAQDASGRSAERTNVAMVCDASFPSGAKAAEQRQNALRLLRAAVETAARALGGAETRVEFVPVQQPPVPAYEPGACARVIINGKQAGIAGLLMAKVQRDYGLERPVAIAEIGLAELVALYPPRSLVHALPEFPAIERDLSLIVPEQTPWAKIDALVHALHLPLLEHSAFIGAFRGQPIAAGRKSVTLRLRFRDPSRTLRREEVDPQMNTLMDKARAELGAEIRV
ncbi:MAG: phenylalanine--tRNA ligase subunit beta [Phycisphaeraceae bacterium]|nr:phenylalanine--tRNA ligase subunit beta [Phycisphaeraceae bacterium]